MKIKTIYIENFGKLKNFKLDLKPGLNIIYGSNESGKTTVMNFIKMMFYGTAGKSSDINKNMRKKYAPWDGAPMSGYIEFESGGQDFRIEREFGNSNISDNISIWNLSTGSSEAVSCKYDAGERFIGMSLSAFEKSVFIGDVSSVVNGTDKEDEISKKLMNYSSSAEENISYEIVRKRLQKAHEELRSKSGRTGVIDRLMSELSEKTEQLSRTEEEEERKIADEELHTSFCEHLQKKKEYYDSLSDRIKEQRIIRELHSLEVQSRKNQVKSRLEEKLNNLLAEISNENFCVTDSFLDECSDMLSELKRLKDTYNERKNEFNSMSNEISELRLSDAIQANYADIDSLEEQRKVISEKITLAEEKLNEIISVAEQLSTGLKETHIKEELYKEHIDDMESNYVTLIPAAIIIIIAIALFLKNPWFLLSAIPVTLVVVAGTKIIEKIQKNHDKKAGIEHKAPDFENAYREYEKAISENQKRSDEIHCETSLLKDELNETERKKSELEKENNRLVLINNQKKSELNKLSSDLEKTRNDISLLETSAVQFFSRYKTVSGTNEIEQFIPEAQDILTEIEKTKAILDSKLEEDLITDSSDQISIRTAQLKEKLSSLTAGKGPKLLTDKQTDDLEEELETLKKDINSLKDEISDMRSGILSRYSSGDNPSVIRNQIDSIKQDISDMSAYDRAVLIASEVMEESGNEIRQTFAPELNSKTERIFSHLTGGRYNETIVSRDLEINSSPDSSKPFRQWRYLSTGTYEQAYLSLRLALADMMTRNQIPVFLDDVFAHYDDERADNGFIFLNEYSRLNQVIFFTCHRYKIVSDQYTVFPSLQ